MGDEFIIAIVAIVSVFVIMPGMVFHYISKWRNDRNLRPDDEQMMSDLWRTAKKMERRLEALERLIADDAEADADPRNDRRPPRSPYDQ